jgi:hypothetical protein
MSCAGCADCSLIRTAEEISPFEIHLTVEKGTDQDLFVKVCEEIGIKPLIIENIMDKGNSISTDLMTRSIVKGSIEEAGLEMFRVAIMLKDRGFNVIRNKIETVPWLYETVKDMSGENNIPYFETHIEIPYHSQNYQNIIKIVHENGGYVSRNAMKDGILMATFRLADVNEEEFSSYNEHMRGILKSHEFVISRNIVELTFHDDNLEHDSRWIDG